jgi:hypothetical protein
MEPFNYNPYIFDPSKEILKSVQVNAVIDAQRKQQEQEAVYQTKADEFFNNPKPTMKDISSFMAVMTPDQQKAFEPYAKSLSEEQKKASLNFGLQIVNSLENDPAVAVKLLRERAVAERNSGNESDASFFENLAGTAEKSPAAAMKVSSLILAAIPGAKEAIDNITASREEQRKAELQPFKISEASADAQLKQIQTRFTPQKLAIDLQLSKEQLKNLQQSRTEQGASIIPLEKRPEAEAKFRKEYSEQTQTYKDVKSSYGRILASNEDAAGDLALVYNYMKMLDPGSVVREGEFATAQNAAGVPDRIRNQLNKLLDGERLNPAQREQFKKQAGSIYNQSLKQEATVRKGIERIATGYGLKPDNIFYEPTETPPTAPATTPATTPAAGKPIVVDY